MDRVKRPAKNVDVAICMSNTFICPRVYVAFILDIIAFNKIINNSRPPAWHFSLTRTGNKEFIIVGLIYSNPRPFSGWTLQWIAS